MRWCQGMRRKIESEISWWVKMLIGLIVSLVRFALSLLSFALWWERSHA
jgi:hypothetical protein